MAKKDDRKALISNSFRKKNLSRNFDIEAKTYYLINEGLVLKQYEVQVGRKPKSQD